MKGWWPARTTHRGCRRQVPAGGRFFRPGVLPPVQRRPGLL